MLYTRFLAPLFLSVVLVGCAGQDEAAVVGGGGTDDAGTATPDLSDNVFSGPSVWKGPNRWFGGHGLSRAIATTATAAVAAFALFLSRRRLDHSDPAVVAGAAVLAYCLLGPYVLPWYVFWGLAALALAWRSRLTWLALLHGAVLHLAYVPDPEIHGQRLDRLFVRSPLQRFQLDLFQMWVPILELCLIVAIIAFSLPRSKNRPARAPDERVLG